MNRDEELRRLRGNDPAEAMGAGIRLSAESADSAVLLNRCRDVMVAVLQHPAADWPDLPTWRSEMPAWFVLACAPEKTPEQEQADLIWWQSLSSDEQATADEASQWSLSDWLWWLEPENRTWYWLGAEVAGPRQLLVYVETDGDPSPTGALRWLLTAAGATQVDES
ncbi:hypothetical protein ACFV9C_32925 [Kribbella sp. NPDC059898]|uniref:hypothetical protein n=1 Tax=Kribbella sp. NPDC059898 TaxID=3346995 RepID=UPI00364FACCC